MNVPQAHALLDALREGRADASSREITLALKLTGDIPTPDDELPAPVRVHRRVGEWGLPREHAAGLAPATWLDPL